MKRLPVALLCLSLIACHPPASIQTPQGKIAYTADQVAQQIGHLEQAVIAANQATPKGIPDQTAIDIVQFCVAAELTLGKTPSGWQQTVATAWGQLKAKYPAVTNPVIQSLIAAVDVAIASWGAGS